MNGVFTLIYPVLFLQIVFEVWKFLCSYSQLRSLNFQSPFLSTSVLPKAQTFPCLTFISSESLNFSEFNFSLILTSSFDFWSRSDLSRTFSSDTVLSSDFNWVISSSVSASLCLFSSFKVNSSLSRTSRLISENWGS